MKDSLLAILFLVLLASLAYTIGAGVLRRPGGWCGAIEKAVFAVPIGMGVVSYTILAAGLLRLFRAPFFYSLLGLGLLALPLAVRDLLRARGIRTGDRAMLWERGALVVLLLLLAFTLVAALAPPTEWDALSYQLGGPKTYLRHGRIFYIPYDHHTNFPFLIQMLYTLMLGAGSVGGAKLCHWLCAVLLTAATYTFAVRHLAPAPRARQIGLAAALILASTPMVVWEATVAYSDLSTALYTFLALYALLNSAARVTADGGKSSAESVRWLILSAAMIGLALATKFTVLAFWGVLLAGILGWNLVVNRRWSGVTLQHAALWGGLSLLIASPWYLKTFLYTGNPTYPFLYSLFGGRYWSAANAAQYARDQAGLGYGKAPLMLLLGPWQATMLPEAAKYTEYFTFSLSPVFVALLLAAPLVGKRLSRPGVIAAAFGLGVTAFWLLSVQQTRYLLPALPAFALVCAETLFALADERLRLARAAGAGLVALAAGWGVYVAGGLAFWGVRSYAGGAAAQPAWPVVSGAMRREEYVDRGLHGLGPAEFWINENTAPTDKVALLDAVQGFYLDRDYLWAQPDHAAGLIPWDDYRDADDWLADFKRRGYTVLLVGARDPNAPSDGERWRSLLDDAIRGDKVRLDYQAPERMGSDGPIYDRVYTIR